MRISTVRLGVFFSATKGGLIWFDRGRFNLGKVFAMCHAVMQSTAYVCFVVLCCPYFELPHSVLPRMKFYGLVYYGTVHHGKTRYTMVKLGTLCYRKYEVL